MHARLTKLLFAIFTAITLASGTSLTAQTQFDRNPKALQQRLVELGYNAGPADGYPGPQTRTALMYFQAEHCLPATGQPDAATSNALDVATISAKPCAGRRPPEGITAISPLLDGVYVDSLIKCDLESLPYATLHLSQRKVSGDGITWGVEDICGTVRTDIRDGITLFRGICYGGNETWESRWRLNVLTNDSFVDIDMLTAIGNEAPRTFRRCASNSTLHNTLFAYAEGTDQNVDSEAGLSLPMSDGVYSFLPIGCPGLDNKQRSDREQIAANLRVTFLDNQFVQGDQSCPIATYSYHEGKGVLSMNCMYGDSPVEYNFEIEPISETSFKRYDAIYDLCSEPENSIANEIVFPVLTPEVYVTANFGAFGQGPIEDPDAYLPGQLHLGTDFGAKKEQVVVAPVSGKIVYYHTIGNSSEDPTWLQTFIVLRDNNENDWILAHVECTICKSHAPVGDFGKWPDTHIVDVIAGSPIGRVANLEPEGLGNHVHVGIVESAIVRDGELLEQFYYGNWSRLTYSEGIPGALEGAQALASSIGFIDASSVFLSP